MPICQYYVHLELFVGTDTLSPLTQPRRTLPHATGNYKEGSVASTPLDVLITYRLRPVKGFQILEHLHGEEGEGGRHQAPEQVVPRKHGCGVVWISVSLVIPAGHGQEMVSQRKDQSSPLLDLPNEILVAILCRLHHIDLVACRQVRLP